MKSEPSINIQIVGCRRLQNELMAHFLNKETGHNTACFSNHETAALASRPDNTISITLVDRSAFSQHVPIEQLLTGPAQSDRDFVILWNVDRDLGEANHAIGAGIRGMFFMDDSLPDLVKGIQAVIRGELWYSREHMSKALLVNNKTAKPVDGPATVLSAREREILSLLVGGKNNDEIGEQLHISPHTVRTHLYNIYRKIQVGSRVQAMLWAARYL